VISDSVQTQVCSCHLCAGLLRLPSDLTPVLAAALLPAKTERLVPRFPSDLDVMLKAAD